jgi:hydroxyethylthiazole kinase-like uncharacterized protein yjeF
MHKSFEVSDLVSLWRPDTNSTGEDNGQVTIIGGSELFTGAPLLSLVAASRLVDMVFLATPSQDKEIAQNIALFSKLRSIIWIPREDLDDYLGKSEAALIGPGLMRYHRENSQLLSDELDVAGTETKMLTHYLLQKFPHKKWVIDGGSLQTMEAAWIPKNAILTPNSHEYELLFKEKFSLDNLQASAHKYSCVILYKGPTSYATDGHVVYEIRGGNAGLTKGGSGDTLAGLIVGLLAKNEHLLAAAAGSLIIKKTAEHLYEQVGVNFNADDVAENLFKVFKLLH